MSRGGSPFRPAVAGALVAAFVAVLSPAAAEAAVLAKGSKGAKVAMLNARLAALTYLPTGATSPRFTLQTHHAVVAFQKLNGLDPDGLVGPLTRRALANAGAPAPRVDRRGRRIEVWRGRQVAFLVAKGKVVRTVDVSTGKARFRTPAGRFRVFRRERMSWSYKYEVWLPWAAYFNGGIALHASADVPPRPASRGCVRVPRPFAPEVYRFAGMRTAVVVL
ncbi:MAG TPA: L,D-transpeptidase family protein [Gaiellaceae bacterium]|nr:L,D-transpeptidase family protein [Gaiellaceae bacterium]